MVMIYIFIEYPVKIVNISVDTATSQKNLKKDEIFKTLPLGRVIFELSFPRYLVFRFWGFFSSIGKNPILSQRLKVCEHE